MLERPMWIECVQGKSVVNNVIDCNQICGERQTAPKEQINDFLERLPELRRDYSDVDIFNADETALYYCVLPDKTLEHCHVAACGKKVSKARITLLLCCSAAGEKLPPLVIGKYGNPRCLRGLKRETLPCVYRNSQNAWMTTSIWSDWLKDFNRRMKLQKRNILLFVDNATPHKVDFQLSNIKVVFMPPNCTSVLQPLDQGVIWSFKCIYRQMILDFIVDNIDSGVQNDLMKSFDIMKAMHFIKCAWIKQHPDTIVNAFRKAGFIRPLEAESSEPTHNLADSPHPFALIDDELFQVELHEIELDSDEVNFSYTVMKSCCRYGRRICYMV